VRLVERVFGSWLWRLPEGSQSVALTFDDGPDPATTPALLTALQSLGISATHFLVGSRCRENLSLAGELSSAGQVVGNHGFDHQSFFLRSGTFQRDSILRTERMLVQVLPEPLHLFRPPYGRFNLSTSGVLRRTGYRGVLWSLGAKDWREQRENVLWDRLKHGLHEGAIILLHDGHPATEVVIHLLPRLAEEVAHRGWRFVPLRSAETADRSGMCW
jgi:peptidoglycan/xylan/chitin deacetylase (PgdA/CDA1 family)